MSSHYLHNLRHSAAHLLAQAVLELYPETKLTIGPVTEHGFFYDLLPVQNFTNDDLPKIEARMHELVKKNYKITGGQVPKAEARKLFAQNPFKLELIDGIEGDTVGVYHQGDFYDLCKGGHVNELGEIKHFKLTGISGSYWRAKRDGQALQRISGIAFATAEDMQAYLQRLEEAKLYDHRALGLQLDLFSFHDEAAGSVFFHDKGLKIFNELIAFSRHMQQDDYQEIKTPLVNHESLYKTSGHYEHYRDSGYIVNLDEAPHWVRPMNCPSCILIFSERPHSYRELPLRIAEYGLCHRYELSGVLHGLFRVRSFTQDDAHIFCTIDQLEDEVVKVLELANNMYGRFNFSEISMALSTRPAQSMGSDEAWKRATEALRNALEKRSCSYIIQEGEGAFYGPKIEIHIKDRMDRSWQCGTVQVDFNMPLNFKLEYVASDQSRQQPVMIHRAIYGSIERFMGVLLEHYKGHLPFWLSPVQIRVLTITDAQQEYAKSIIRSLKAAGLRVELDHSSDKISAQIRRAQLDKVPWMIVIGAKEQEAGMVTLRHVSGEQEHNQRLEEIIAKARVLTAF